MESQTFVLFPFLFKFDRPRNTKDNWVRRFNPAVNNNLASKLIKIINPFNSLKNSILFLGVFFILLSIPITTYLVQNSREPISHA